MIKEITFDTNIFQKKIGILTVDDHFPAGIEVDLKSAKENGYQYLMCKLQSQETSVIRRLESFGFYLNDISVVWTAEIEKILRMLEEEEHAAAESIIVAGEEELLILKKLINSLFSGSRYYNDPFFSKEEADRLHVTWIENSIKGVASDVVLYLPDTGFITCKKREERTGNIVLIGLKECFRGKGLGLALAFAAIKWFESQNVRIVNVKTQLKNIKAMNFYRKLGFIIKEFEITFGKII